MSLPDIKDPSGALREGRVAAHPTRVFFPTQCKHNGTAVGHTLLVYTPAPGPWRLGYQPPSVPQACYSLGLHTVAWGKRQQKAASHPPCPAPQLPVSPARLHGSPRQGSCWKIHNNDWQPGCPMEMLLRLALGSTELGGPPESVCSKAPAQRV